MPATENSPVVFDSFLVASAGNRLYIFNKDGNLIKVIKDGNLIKVIAVLAGGGNLTKPVVKNGLIVLGSDMGGIFAYSLKGELLWKDVSAGQIQFGNTPVVCGSMIALPTVDKGIQFYQTNGVYAGDIAETREKAVYSTPLFVNNGKYLVYAAEDGIVSAYNLTNKAIVYSKKFARGRVVEPVIGNDKIAILFYHSGNLSAFNPLNGESLWDFEADVLKKAACVPFLLSNQLLTLSTTQSDSVLLSVDLEKGKLNYSRKLSAPVQSASLIGNHFYLALTNGVVEVLNLDNQELLRDYPLSGSINQLAVSAEGVFVFTSENLIRLKP